MPDYFAYLLRLWTMDGTDHRYVRASLEDVRTRQIDGFDSLDSLVAYLRGLEHGDGDQTTERHRGEERGSGERGAP
ncbi:MAG: hypothetical protein ACYC5O_21395 [Anaerolineae bacterium]